MAYEIGAAYLSILPSADGFANALGRQLDGPFQSVGRQGGDTLGRGVGAGGQPSFLAAGKMLGGALVAGFAAIGATQIVDAVVGWVSDAVDAASNLAETQNKVNEIFGDGAGSLIAYAKTADERLGQSRQTFLDGAATIGIFGQSAGLAGEDLAGFSVDLVELATDLASFNNTSPEDAIQAIGAALRGESEPIRRYGVLLDEATLKSRAMALGIIDATTNALTPQQRVLAAQAEILAQTGTAQGDYARTADQYANAQRSFNAEMENFQAEIGSALLPVVSDLFATFREVGMPILERLSTWFSENPETVRLFVLSLVQGGLMIVDAFLWVGQALGNFGQFFMMVMHSLVSSFLMFVGSFLDGAAAAFGWIPEVGDNLTDAQQDFEDFRAGVNDKFTKMRDIVDIWAGSIDLGRNSVHLLQQSINDLNGTTATVSVLAKGDGWRFIQNGNLTPYFNTSGGSTGWTGATSRRAEGGPVSAGQPYIVGERSWELFVPDRPGTIYNPQQLAAMAAGGGGMTNNITIYDQHDPVATAHETTRHLNMLHI